MIMKFNIFLKLFRKGSLVKNFQLNSEKGSMEINLTIFKHQILLINFVNARDFHTHNEFKYQNI
jgi:hypothetical protein